MTSDSHSTADAEIYGPRIATFIAQYGEVPPLWAYAPRIHPMSIYWRMGTGEDHEYLFNAWAVGLTWSIDDRVAYLRRWNPPFSWLESVASFLWPEDFSDSQLEPTDEHFARMHELGFGSRFDWERCFDVKPEDYPLLDDVSSGWLETNALLPR